MEEFAILCCIGLVMLVFSTIRNTELEFKNMQLKKEIKDLENIDKK